MTLSKCIRAFSSSALISLFLFAGCLDSGHSTIVTRPVYGAKIYSFDGNADSLFVEWRRIGLNTAWIGKELFADASFREAAHSHGIETFVVLPSFFDPDALDADSTLAAITSLGEPAVDDWVRFVCPSNEEFRKRKIDEIVRIVREWQPDGISIDFIRHFVFWETVFPDTPADSLPNTCFDDRCMMAFQEATGVSKPKSVEGSVASAKWI